MKHGFVLIEIIIALMIASVIGVALLNSFSTINKSASSIDNYVQTHEKAATLLYQFERDIAGAFVPFEPEQEEDQQKQAQQPSPAPADAVVAVKKEKQKPLTHIFYGTNQDDGRLDELTFITNNPLQIYASSGMGKSNVRVARVAYRLKPENKKKIKKKKPSFVLVRQESFDLDYDSLEKKSKKEVRSYEVIDGVRSIKVKYGFERKEKEAKQEAQKTSAPATNAKPAQKEAPKKNYKIVDEWDDQEQETRIPKDVQVSLALWDARHERDLKIIFNVHIVPDFQEKKPQEKTDATSPEKEKEEASKAQATTSPEASKGAAAGVAGTQQGQPPAQAGARQPRISLGQQLQGAAGQSPQAQAPAGEAAQQTPAVSTPQQSGPTPPVPSDQAVDDFMTKAMEEMG